MLSKATNKLPKPAWKRAATATAARSSQPVAAEPSPEPKPATGAPNDAERANAGAGATTLLQRLRGRDWAPIYMAAIEATGGNYTRAARAAGVGRTTVWERRKKDAEFEREEIAAIKRGVKSLEAEAVRRAVEGVKKIRFEPKSGTIHYEREYSDTLLLRLLEHSETGSWRQKQQIEHSGGLVFKTRAERKEALERARQALHQPVTATNSRN